MRGHNCLAVTAVAIGTAFATAEAPAVAQAPSPTGGVQAPENLPPTKEERAQKLTEMLHSGIVPPFLGNTDVIGRRRPSKTFYDFRVGLAVVDHALNGERNYYKIVPREKRPDGVEDFRVEPVGGKHLSETPNRLNWAPTSDHEYDFQEIVTGAIARVTKRGSLATLIYSQHPTTYGAEFTVRPGHERPFKSDIVIAQAR